METATINWRTVIDTDDGRVRFINEKYQQLAAGAWQAYLESGPGALWIDLRTAPNAVTFAGVSVWGKYIPLAEFRNAENNGDDPDAIEGIARLITSYDPTREFVLLILSGDPDYLRGYCLPDNGSDEKPTPPEAYRAEQNARRNNPYLS